MRKDDKYENYISFHFAGVHDLDNIQREYVLMEKYYKKNYLPLLPKDRKAKILDVGCGMGHFLYFLKETGYSDYIGIDLSKECVNFCRQNKLGGDKEIVHVDLDEYLSQPELKFDVVVMNDVIEHIEKEKIISVLKNIKKNLHKGGILIVKVVNSANPITGSSSCYYDFTHTLGFTEESLSQVLRKSGFEKVKMFPQNIFVFNPLVNLIGKSTQNFFNFLFRLLFVLYGRKTTKIFTKDIIAVAKA